MRPRPETLLTRRRLVGTGAVSLAATLPLTAHGQPSTPAPAATADASPVVSPAIDVAELLSLSERLTAISPLPEDPVADLARLISADPALVAAYSELRAIPDPAAPEALDDASRDTARLAGNILSFWYVGTFDGLPVPGRADRFAGLLAWQTLPYTTILTVCKGFGYWAREVPVTFD